MIKELQMFNGVEYDRSHGSPFDRGSADSYYGRQQNPHKYPNGTGHAPRVDGQDMTQNEVKAYYAGYEWNEQLGDKKNWN
jgi:hypothetical protein